MEIKTSKLVPQDIKYPNGWKSQVPQRGGQRLKVNRGKKPRADIGTCPGL